MILPALAFEIRYLLKQGKVENPSDVRLLTWALNHPEEATEATNTWFEAVIRRNGKAHPGARLASPA